VLGELFCSKQGLSSDDPLVLVSWFKRFSDFLLWRLIFLSQEVIFIPFAAWPQCFPETVGWGSPLSLSLSSPSNGPGRCEDDITQDAQLNVPTGIPAKLSAGINNQRLISKLRTFNF
jgi:hypothetical protein